MTHDSGPIVGIDLGTTNSLVAVCDAAGPRVIPDSSGRSLLPSVVRVPSDGSRPIVGYEARDTRESFISSTLSSTKRLMGRGVADIEPVRAMLPYEIVAGARDTLLLRITDDRGTRLITPEEVASMILSSLQARASAALGVPVTRAVVTVPAYFDDAQRQATRDAGRLAGLDVVRIVNEPTAAALAYGLGVGAPERPQTVAVYDLGGGTFDISVLRISPEPAVSSPDGGEGGTSVFQVLATAGDTSLGGDDIDRAILSMVHPEIVTSSTHLQRLLSEAERVKHELTDREIATFDIALDDGSHLTRTVTRDQLAAAASPWIERTLTICERVLTDATRAIGADARSALDAVVLVGGSTRMPLVRRRVREFFGIEPYTALNPDEVVALGASVQASVLSGASRNALLLDVIPLSLGVETAGGAFAKIIVRNSTVPTRATEMFSTSVENQTSIRLTVLQGEREMAADCRALGVFHLRGIPPMPAGLPQVEVEFLIDANGVLNVSALERRSGIRASLQVVPNHGLTPDEIDRIERESFANARDDMARHRIVDLIQNARLAIGWTRDRLHKVGAAVRPEERVAAESAIVTLEAMVLEAERDWRSVNADVLHAAKEALEQSSVPLHEAAITRALNEMNRNRRNA